MAITTYNTAPYFDDLNVKDSTGRSANDKNYLRILFQPGFAVQTRELNQMQSVLQSQIDRLGSSFYRDGEAALDGESNFRDNIVYVEINRPSDVTIDNLIADISRQKNIEIKNNSIVGGEYAEVLGIDTITSDRIRIYISPITKISDSPNQPLSQLLPNGSEVRYKNDIQITSSTGSVNNSNPIGTIVKSGYAFSLSVNEGIYYIKGSFVHTPSMVRFWIKNSASEIVRGDACLIVTENTITSAQDPTLLDNSTGSYNYEAPGADRYQISLDLGFFEVPFPGVSPKQYPIRDIANQSSNIFAKDSTQSFSISRLFTVDESDVEIIENREDSNLEKRLARRTYEESGNYTIRPFKIAFRDFAAQPGYDIKDPVYTSDEISSQNPFGITSVEESTKKFILQVEPSIAYVNGFRYEFKDKTTLAINKARTTRLVSNYDLTFPVGNYFDITLPDSPTYNSPSRGEADYVSGTVPISNRRTLENINAYYINAQNSPGPEGMEVPGVSGFNSPGNIIKSIQYISDKGIIGGDATNSPQATYRVYVNKGVTFADVEKAFPYFMGKVNDGAGATSDLSVINTLGTNQAENAFALNDMSNDGLLFRLPGDAVQRVTQLRYTKYKRIGGLDGTLVTTANQDLQQHGILTLIAGSGETFTSTSQSDKYDYIVIKRVTLSDGTLADRVVNPEYYNIADNPSTTQVILRANDTSAESKRHFVNSPESGDRFIVFAPVEVSGGVGSERAKTLTVGTTTVDATSYPAGSVITLDDCDIVRRTITGAGGNLDNQFEIIDDGLDDPEFYRRVKIKLNGIVDFSSNNTITYQYYDHGEGDYFTVNSYGDYTQDSPNIQYEGITKYREQSLANFIDFRVKETLTDARSGVEYGPVSLVPNRISSVSFREYLSRQDRLIISGDGEILTVEGDPSSNPVLPKEPENSLTLYTYFVPAFTGQAKDVVGRYINNQRSTMKDIGRIKRRVENIERYSALSVLESNALNKNVLNEDGTQRFKSGILVDNFRRDKTANPYDPSYLAATDRTSGILRPYYHSNQARLFYQYPAGPIGEQSSAADYSDRSQVTVNDFYVDNTPNSYKFDIVENKSVVISGRPLSLSVSGFKIGDVLNDATNGAYHLYNPNFNNYPEYRKISDSVPLSKSSRRIRRGDNGWLIEVLKTDQSGYETEYYTNSEGLLGNDAPYPSDIAVGSWRSLSGEAQDEGSIKSLANDRIATNLPESTTASTRSRFTIDGANNGEMLTLWNGQKEVLFEQINATKSVSIQPFEVANYVGKIKLSPSGDEWIDTTRLPAQVIQDNTIQNVMSILEDVGVFEDKLGTFWNHVEVVSQGSEVLTDAVIGRTRTIITETTTEEVHTGIERTLESGEIIEESQGDKVVDINIVPFIRSRDVSIYATGLRPNTRIYAFFDEKDVTDYVAATEDFREFGLHEHVKEYNGEGAPDSRLPDGPFQSEDLNHYELPLYTSAETGEFFGTFRIPNNDDLRFRTGLREFKLTSSKINRDDDADCIAKTTYAAYSLNQSVEETVVASRPMEFVETSVERTVTTTRIDVQRITHDPVAQTFTIPKSYSNGVCVTDIDVYFAEKPNFPANVEVTIVPTEQGLPTNRTIPGSRSVLTPAQVNVPAEGRDTTDPSQIIPTNFKFDYPIYLKSNTEYAIIVFSPSPDYRVWVSEIGGNNIINSGRPITTNAGFGVFLKSQNRSTWTPDQTKDLMFTLNKGVFRLSRTYEFNTKASGAYSNNQQKIGEDQGPGANNVKISAFNLASDNIIVPSTSCKYNVDFRYGYGYLSKSVYGIPDSCVAKKTYELLKEIDTVSEGVDNIRVQVTLTGKDRGDGLSDITPLLDLHKNSIITFENYVPQTPENSLAESGLTLQEARNNIKGFVTKNVKLSNPADNLRILLGTNRISAEGDLKVYTKARGISDNCPWENKNWEVAPLKYIGGREIVTNSSYSPSLPVNGNHEEFSEAEYSFNSSLGEISEYAVKIAFVGSGDSAKIVRAKDLRIIATA